MFIVHVFVHVLPDCIDAFKDATVENARNSVQEPGVARFDFIQELENETSFLLVEVYRDKDAAAAHKETAHYATWRDTVVSMMARPRTNIKYDTVFPGSDGYNAVNK